MKPFKRMLLTFDFNSSSILESIMNAIDIEKTQVVRAKHPFLQYRWQEWGLFWILNNSRALETENLNLPSYSSRYQMNWKLFALGSKQQKSGKIKYSGPFFSVNKVGQLHKLASLPENKICSSLTGDHSILISVGGYNNNLLKTCHLYSLKSDKWVGLPPLNTPRFFPGSCLLQSVTAFSFCGGKERTTSLNSIETIHLRAHNSWRSLPVD